MNELPTLVINAIFDYLSLKERIKCKSVCVQWRIEIELKDKNKEVLILHTDAYSLNRRWLYTNNRGLMRYENSFEMKSLDFLKQPFTRSYFKSIKKLAIFDFAVTCFEIENFYQYINFFSKCEKIEINGVDTELDEMLINLPKLRVLAISHFAINKLIIDCPLLHTFIIYPLFCKEIIYKNPKPLKHLEAKNCFLNFKITGKFTSLEFFKLFNELIKLDGNLLSKTPNLKQLIIYTKFNEDIKYLENQKKLHNLNELDILVSGFKGIRAVRPAINKNPILLKDDNEIGKLFDNYSNLVENSIWNTKVDYFKLIQKFKILPSNFFEKFYVRIVVIEKVYNYLHLFQFLKFCSHLEAFDLYYSNVDSKLILGQSFIFAPSLILFRIFEDNHLNLIEFGKNLAFIRFLEKLICICIASSRIPVKLIKKVFKGIKKKILN